MREVLVAKVRSAEGNTELYMLRAMVKMTVMQSIA